MSIRVMDRVWEHSQQSSGALLVLLAISDFADDDGVAFPSIRTLARKARLSERQVQRVIAELVAAQELEITPGQGRAGSHLYRVTVGSRPRVVTGETGDNMSPRHRRREGVTYCHRQGVTPASPKPSYREPSSTVTPLPPSSSTAPPELQQGGPIESTETACPSPPAPGSVHDDTAARVLTEALYRGLDTDLQQLTPALRRRELAIARQLVDVGATPGEAEAYAREARSHAGRIAAVDVRSYERERLSWNARRQVERQATLHRVDRTGEPPRGVHAGSLARALFGAGARP